MKHIEKNTTNYVHTYINTYTFVLFIYLFWECSEVLWLHEETLMSGSIADTKTIPISSFNSQQCTVLPHRIENRPLYTKGQVGDASCLTNYLI